MPVLFKEFVTESRSLMLQPDEYVKVADLTKKYIDKFKNIKISDTRPLPKHFFKDIKFTKTKNDLLTSPRFLKLASIELIDRQSKRQKLVDIIVVYNYPNPPYSGLYREEAEEILLFNDALKHQTYYKVFEIVSHEIIHAVQYYKRTSDAYERAVEKDLDGDELAKIAYYTEPVEFEATLGGVISQLEITFQDFLNLIKKYITQNDQVSLNFFIRKTEHFIKAIQLFAKSTPETYFKYQELEIPAPLRSREAFFRVMSQLPYYKRKYQKGLITLTDSLQDQLQNTLS